MRATITPGEFCSWGAMPISSSSMCRRPTHLVRCMRARGARLVAAIALLHQTLCAGAVRWRHRIMSTSSWSCRAPPPITGLRALQGRQQLEQLVRFVKDARDRLQWGPSGPPPLLVKIAPDLTAADKADIAAVAAATRVDGLVVGNTTITRPGGCCNGTRSAMTKHADTIACRQLENRGCQRD